MKKSISIKRIDAGGKELFCLKITHPLKRVFGTREEKLDRSELEALARAALSAASLNVQVKSHT